MPLQQPEIDWSNPLTRTPGGILAFAGFALPNGTFYDAVSKQYSQTFPLSQQRLDTSVDGLGVQNLSIVGSSSNSAKKFVNPTGMDTINNSYSIFMESAFETASTSVQVIQSLNPGNGNGFSLAFDDTNTMLNGIRNFINSSGNSTGFANNMLGPAEAKKKHRCAVTFDSTAGGTSNLRAYARGKFYNVRSQSGTPTADSSRRTYIVSDAGSGFQHSSSASVILVWSGLINLNQFQELYNNPRVVTTKRSFRIFTSGPAPLPSGTSIGLGTASAVGASVSRSVGTAAGAAFVTMPPVGTATGAAVVSGVAMYPQSYGSGYASALSIQNAVCLEYGLGTFYTPSDGVASASQNGLNGTFKFKSVIDTSNGNVYVGLNQKGFSVQAQTTGSGSGFAQPSYRNALPGTDTKGGPFWYQAPGPKYSSGIFSDGLPAQSVSITQNGNGAFTLYQIDLASLPYYEAGAGGPSTTINFVGTLAGGGTVSQTVNHTVSGYATHLLTGFVNVTSVVMTSSGAPLYQFDNIILSPVINLPYFRSSANAANTSTSTLTVPIPPGTVTNDLLIALVQSSNGAWSPPDGSWSLLATNVATPSSQFSVYSKRASATEPTSYTFNSSITAGITDISISSYGAMSPPVVDVIGTIVNTAGTTATSVTATGITTTQVGLLLSLLGANTGGGGLQWATPANWSKDVDDGYQSSGDTAIFHRSDTIPSIGSSGTASFTYPTTATVNGVLLNIYAPTVISGIASSNGSSSASGVGSSQIVTQRNLSLHSSLSGLGGGPFQNPLE